MKKIRAINGFLYFSHFTWAALNASLCVYLIPFLIGGQSTRALVIDSWFLLNSALFLYLSRGKVLGSSIFPGAFAFSILFVFSVTSFVNGYFYSDFGVESVREFRIIFYFLACYIVFTRFFLRSSLEERNIFIAVSVFGALAGNIVYFALSKYLFKDYSLFYLPESEYSDTFIDAFTLGVEQKFKYAPPLIAFAQMFTYYLYINRKINFGYLAAISLPLLIVSVMSNMRSVILSEFLALFLIGCHLLNLRKSKNIFIVFLVSLFFIFVWLGIKDAALSFLNGSRFASQVVEKGITTDELSNRLYGLAVSFGIEGSRAQSLIGFGTGAAFSSALWYDLFINPADSGFFHVLLTGGFLLLFSYTLFLMLTFFKSLVLALHKANYYSLMLVVAMLCAVGNNFNDSPLLLISDAFILALICSLVNVEFSARSAIKFKLG